MTEPAADEFECPVCRALLQSDWKACPNCGVELDWTEPAPPTAGAPDLPAAGVVNLQRAIGPPASAAHPPPPPPPPFEPLDQLEHEIKAALAPPSRAGAVPPPKKAPTAAATRASRSKKRKRRRAPGTLLGNAGLALLTAGVGGVLVAVNYDTWVRGQANSAIGSVQQLGIMGMDLVAATGAVLVLVALGRLKRKPARSA